jgi:hypothetical protein
MSGRSHASPARLRGRAALAAALSRAQSELAALRAEAYSDELERVRLEALVDGLGHSLTTSLAELGEVRSELREARTESSAHGHEIESLATQATELRAVVMMQYMTIHELSERLTESLGAGHGPQVDVAATGAADPVGQVADGSTSAEAARAEASRDTDSTNADARPGRDVVVEPMPAPAVLVDLADSRPSSPRPAQPVRAAAFAAAASSALTSPSGSSVRSDVLPDDESVRRLRLIREGRDS